MGDAWEPEARGAEVAEETEPEEAQGTRALAVAPHEEGGQVGMAPHEPQPQLGRSALGRSQRESRR